MRNRLIINTSQLEQNYLNLNEINPSSSSLVMPVIKANGYGHGAKIIAAALDKMNPAAFGVADLNEAIEISQMGLKTPCFNFGYCDPLLLKNSLEYNTILCVFNIDNIDFFGQIASGLKSRLRLHIKVDTGMNRLGLKADDWQKAVDLIKKYQLEGAIKGIMTHLSDSDQLDPEHSKRQLEQFNQAKQFFERSLKQNLVGHCASSSPIQSLSIPVSQFDWIRPGIALYGYPYQKTDKLKPVLQWKAKIIQIKDLNKGESVGYNQSFTALQSMRMAVISVGYGDGFFKEYAQHTLYYKNTPCKIIGQICMDMCMVDISHITEPQLGDEINLISEKKSNNVLHLSQQTNKSIYEILTSLSKRIARETVSN